MKFINNKYKKIYLRLVTSRKNMNRPLGKGTGYEDHHILPRSIYPEYIDAKWNLVPLTPKEHFIAHLLLIKIYEGSARVAMIRALHLMRNRASKRINSRLYDMVKKEYSEIQSKAFKGIARPIEYRIAANKAREKEWTFFDPEGNKITVINLAEFCRNKGWKESSGLHAVLKGRVQSYKGYTLNYISEKDRINKRLQKMKASKRKTIRVLNPDGLIIDIDDIRDYCKTNNLSYQMMTRLVSGKVESHRGYRLARALPILR